MKTGYLSSVVVPLKKIARRSVIAWTDYVHEFDKEMVFTVSSGSFVAGATSYHDNWRE